MKNNLFTKFISVIIAIAIIFPLAIPVYAEEETTIFNEANILLQGLGFADASSKKDEIITRDEFLNLLVKNSHYESVDASKLPEMGIYADTNYYFIPDNYISFENAIKFCVKLLITGGQEASDGEIISIARNLDLYDGISLSGSDYLSYEDAYILTLNFLKTDISTCPNRFTVGGTSLLSDKYKISIAEGIVDAGGIYTLNQNEVSDGEISISDATYLYAPGGEDLFGRYVKAYVQKSGSKMKIVALIETGDTKIHTITSYNDALYGNNVFTYHGENDKTYAVKVSKKADVFYNGAVYTLENETQIPESGIVTVIDNKCYADGADIVLIEEADSRKIIGINEDSEIIYTSGKNFDLSEISETGISDDTGAPISLSDLAIGDIVSFYQDKSFNVWKAIKLTKTVTGTVNEVSSSELIISGSAYKLASGLRENISDYLGEGVTLTIDTYGIVIYLQDGVSDSQRVGIITACGYFKNGFDETLSFKIFDSTGELMVYDAHTKVYVNDTPYEELDKAYAAVPKKGTNVKQSIVSYRLNNEGNLSSISFPSDKLMDASSNAGLYKTAYDDGSDGEVGYKKDRDRLGTNIFVEGSTLLFNIPMQATSGELSDDIEHYSVSKMSSFADATEWSSKMATGWSISNEDKVASYVVIEYNAGTGEVASSIGNDTRVSMVGKISTVINKEGEVVEAATIYNDKERKGVVVYGKTENFFTQKNIAPGDVVRVTYTSATKIAGDAELVYKKGSLQFEKPSGDNIYLYGGAGGGENQKCEIRLSRVYKTWGKVIDIVYPNVDLASVADSDIKSIKTDTYFLARYDERTKQVVTSNVNDLFNYTIAGNECSWVVMYDRWNDSRCLYIVK